ncbi:hypothetical protein Drorol1_Dr00018766 [Drosera rotundifolia]
MGCTGGHYRRVPWRRRGFNGCTGCIRFTEWAGGNGCIGVREIASTVDNWYVGLMEMSRRGNGERWTYRRVHIVGDRGCPLLPATTGPKAPTTRGTATITPTSGGIPHLRAVEYRRIRLARNQRTVNRSYGGVLSGGAVRERIIRAFLVEEQKIVKKVLKIQ